MRLACVVIALLVTACTTVPPESKRLEFAVIGDNPYVDFNEPKYERMIDRINDHGGLAWVVHVGDVKGGGQPCADDFLTARFELNRQFDMPFVLTPGDNDWFDCQRESAGGWDRLDRLAVLRRIFFADDDGMPVVRQSDFSDYPDYVENAYWVEDGVVFATVHLIGLSPGEGGEDIHAGVMEAGLAWIDRVFEVATANDARGVFLATQVDFWLATILPPLLPAVCRDCPYIRPGYEPIDARLALHAKNFGKPVALAVGDTHIFRVDKPLYSEGQLVENFTRVETFGHPTVHWVRVVVDPTSNEVFEFHQELIEDNFGVGWSEHDRPK